MSNKPPETTPEIAAPNRALFAVLFLILVPFVVVESVGVALFAATVHLNYSLTGVATLAQLVVVTGLRAITLAAYAAWARPRRVLQLNYGVTAVSAAAAVIAIPLGFVISNNFQIPSPYQPEVIREAHHSIARFGLLLGSANTGAQYLYYASEGLLIVFLTAGFQALAEAHSLGDRIPWGGFGLALTWGLLHITTKGFVVTVAAVVTGLLVGGLYLLGKKNLWAPFALWMAITVL